MEKLVKKILVLSFAVVSMFLFSNVTFAQNYLLKVAFVGKSNLKNDIVRRIFHNSNTSTSESDLWITWGIHIQNEDATFLYKFKDVNLDINDLTSENMKFITECNIVFIVVDFSDFNVYEIEKHILKIRSMFERDKYARIMIIGKNINNENSEILNSIKSMYELSNGINPIDFLMISDNDNFREKFFEMAEINAKWDEFSLLLMSRNSLPIDVVNYLGLKEADYRIKKHDAEIAVHTVEINNLKKENAELKKEIEILRHDFEKGLLKLGSESWQILEKVANILSREGYIDKDNCENVINAIKDVSKQYGVFQEAFNIFKVYVNNIVKAHGSEINCFKKDVRKQINAFGASMADFTSETTRRVDSFSQRLDDDENNLQEQINRTNFSLDETRIRLDRREREFNMCISNLHGRIDRSDGETSNRLNEMAQILKDHQPVFKAITELEGSFTEFMNDFDIKLSLWSRETKRTILDALKKVMRIHVALQELLVNRN